METSAVWVKVDESAFAQRLRDLCTNLSEGEGEILLDLSSIHRIGTDALRTMEQLAKTATEKKRKVALRGVDVKVYKVLKVAKLTGRFTFVN